MTDELNTTNDEMTEELVENEETVQGETEEGGSGEAYVVDVADLADTGTGDDDAISGLSLGAMTPAVVTPGSLANMLDASLMAVNASYQVLETLSYAARTWQDDTTQGPWLNASNLNSMDGQIETLTDAVNTLNGNIEAVKSDLESLGDSVCQVRWLTSSDDLDNIHETGIYLWGTGDAPANYPSGCYTMLCLQTAAQNSETCRQICFDNTKIAARRYGGTPRAWSAWSSVALS